MSKMSVTPTPLTAVGMSTVILGLLGDEYEHHVELSILTDLLDRVKNDVRVGTWRTLFWRIVGATHPSIIHFVINRRYYDCLRTLIDMGVVDEYHYYREQTSRRRGRHPPPHRRENDVLHVFGHADQPLPASPLTLALYNRDLQAIQILIVEGNVSVSTAESFDCVIITNFLLTECGLTIFDLDLEKCQPPVIAYLLPEFQHILQSASQQQRLIENLSSELAGVYAKLEELEFAPRRGVEFLRANEKYLDLASMTEAEKSQRYTELVLDEKKFLESLQYVFKGKEEKQEILS